MPSAAPQICTKSSFVSFSKSAPGEQQKEILLKEMEKELARLPHGICLHTAKCPSESQQVASARVYMNTYTHTPLRAKKHWLCHVLYAGGA